MAGIHPLNTDIADARTILGSNISLRVDTFSSQNAKEESIIRRVEFADKPGVVYVATHKNAETIAADLNRSGIPAVFYHGGLRPSERDEVQNCFMSGQVQVIVATNAFGIGLDRTDLDKPEIRFVYHADVSDSLDAYYQEIGRAGRDGEPAEAVLFYRPQDISAQQFKTGPAHIDTAALEAVFNVLRRRRSPIHRHDLADASGIPPRKLAGLLQKLEDAGAANLFDSGEVEAASKRPLAEIVDDAAHRQQAQKEIRKLRLKKMQQFAEWRSCRREFLLRYVGDDFRGPCGNCDRCEASGVLRRAA
jgi:ATP-dependent DNA helicase RecQ